MIRAVLFETVSPIVLVEKRSGKEVGECSRYLRSITFRFSAMYPTEIGKINENRFFCPLPTSTLIVSPPYTNPFYPHIDSCRFTPSIFRSPSTSLDRAKSVKDALIGYFRSYFGAIKIR